MFSSFTVLPDSKETKLESNKQEASPSAGKNTGVTEYAPLPLFAGWGGVESPTKFSKRGGGLTGPRFLEGGCWERGG